MHLDPLLLSRLQFAWVVAWHFLLPAFTVGLASFIAALEGLHLFTGRAVYLRISMFWIKIFAVSFGMGVVSGITMPFQFGTNWSRFSDAVANIVSPLLAYEGLTAFFLEAAFLGVLLFGRKLRAALGAFLLRADGGARHARLHLLDPVDQQLDADAGGLSRWPTGGSCRKTGSRSSSTRRSPTGSPTSSSRSTSPPASSSSASPPWLLRRRFYEEARIMLSMTLWLLTVLVPLQAMIGDQHGLNTLRYQPAKLAAIEALWDTGRRLPWVVFAIPDDAAANNLYELSIPDLGSLILTHDVNGDGARPEGLSARGSPAGRHPVLRLPHHAARAGAS